MVFVGMSDSCESYYQSIRRCYRYGQTRVVDAHIVLPNLEHPDRGQRAAQGTEAAVVAQASSTTR